MELKYIAENCTGCGLCVNVCPHSAISISEEPNHVAVIARSECDNCFFCVDACYDNALNIFGRMYTVDELMAVGRLPSIPNLLYH